jgi:hypothetical protein
MIPRRSNRVADVPCSRDKGLPFIDGRSLIGREAAWISRVAWCSSKLACWGIDFRCPA